MSSTQVAEKNVTLSSEIFDHPGLDIYTQMVCIVLHMNSSESTLPSLADISRLGRMSVKQATSALQKLTELKILTPKLFRQIVGEFSDDRLSWAAKGIFAYCKHHPQATLRDLVELAAQSGENESTIRKMIRELGRLGYLEDLPELQKVNIDRR